MKSLVFSELICYLCHTEWYVSAMTKHFTKTDLYHGITVNNIIN